MKSLIPKKHSVGEEAGESTALLIAESSSSRRCSTFVPDAAACCRLDPPPPKPVGRLSLSWRLQVGSGREGYLCPVRRYPWVMLQIPTLSIEAAKCVRKMKEGDSHRQERQLPLSP